MDNEQAEPRWLEVSLVVNGEMAEAVSDVLGRFVSNGVVVESGVVYNDAEDEGTPVGPLRIYGYLPVDEALEENRRRLEEALWHLGQIQPLPAPAYKPIVDEDWMAAWKQHYHPIPIGKRLLVLPAWIEMDTGGRLPVRIDPSMAFGTGTHPTTQLCLELEETWVQPGQPVIDVGCGSGILSIAALKLGANRALAVDIDPQAVRSTRENAEDNGVLAQLETGIGSVAELLQGQFTGGTPAKAPLVLANILAPVIVRLFDAGLAELVTPGATLISAAAKSAHGPAGTLILSGILASQAADVEAAALAHGLTPIARLQMEDWVAIVCQ